MSTCTVGNGKEFENFPHIAQELSQLSRQFSGVHRNDDLVIDGEITGKSFQELMRGATRKDHKATDSVFNVFDMMDLEDFKRGFCNRSQIDRLFSTRSTNK